MTRRLPPLVARIVHEHRRALWAIGAGIVLNLLVYAFGVYPLAQRVANVEQRNEAARQALLEARQEHGAASGALAGKDRATTELATFYDDVLPRGFAAARRLTHLRVAQLAREHGLRYTRATSEPEPERNSTLTRLKTGLSLAGSYAEIRSFIHEMETSPEFVIIDDVQLIEGRDSASAIEVTMALSTFYREEVQP